jgi:hypothetical protein
MRSVHKVKAEWGNLFGPLSFRIFHVRNHWTDFGEIWNWKYVIKEVQENYVQAKNTVTLHETQIDLHILKTGSL